MPIGDKRVNTQTSEPEILTAGGWVTDWEALTSIVGESLDYVPLHNSSATSGNIAGYTWQQIKDEFEEVNIAARMGSSLYPLGNIPTDTLVSNMIVREGHADSSRWSFNFGALSGSSFSTGTAGLGTITYLSVVGIRKKDGQEFVKKDDVIPLEDISDVEFLIADYKPTQGSTEFPADANGEIRNTGSSYTLGVDLSTASRVEIQFQERTGSRRQWAQILNLDAQFSDGQVKGLSTPYDTWHVNTRVTNVANGTFWFSETAVNANLVSIKVYGKRSVKNVIPTGTVEVDTTGIADGDTLVWDAANSKFIKSAAAGGGDTKVTAYEFTIANTTANQAKTLTGSAAIKTEGYEVVGYEVYTKSGTGYLGTTQVGVGNSAWAANVALNNVTGTSNLSVNYYATGASVRGKVARIVIKWAKGITTTSV